MNRPNLLNLVAKNLTYIDLAIFSQVSKTANSVCSKDELWQTECMRIYVGNLEMYGLQTYTTSQLLPVKSNYQWKEMLRDMVMAQKEWQTLAGDVFTVDDLKILEESLLTNLLNPAIPAPILRREPKSYPTVMQDMIANELFPSQGI